MGLTLELLDPFGILRILTSFFLRVCFPPPSSPVFPRPNVPVWEHSNASLIGSLLLINTSVMTNKMFLSKLISTYTKVRKRGLPYQTSEITP